MPAWIRSPSEGAGRPFARPMPSDGFRSARPHRLAPELVSTVQYYSSSADCGTSSIARPLGGWSCTVIWRYCSDSGTRTTSGASWRTFQRLTCLGGRWWGSCYCKYWTTHIPDVNSHRQLMSWRALPCRFRSGSVPSGLGSSAGSLWATDLHRTEGELDARSCNSHAQPDHN